MPKNDQHNFLHNMDFIIALFFTIALFFWSYWTVPWYFHVNDDMVPILLPNGSYMGSGTPNLIYMSSLLGRILVGFYKVFPKISWYPIFMYILTFLSVFFIYSYIFKYFFNRPIYLISALFISFLYFPIFISSFTYTMTGFILALAALIAFFPCNSSNNISIFIYGLLLGLVYLIRKEVFWGGILIGALFWIIPAIKDKREILIFLIGICIMVGAGLISDYFAYSKAEWKGYFRFKKTFTFANDPLYNDAISSIMVQNRWSGNDLKTYREQFWFINEEKFSVENMENAVEINKKYTPSIFKILNTNLWQQMMVIYHNHKIYVEAAIFLFVILCVYSYGHWDKIALQFGLFIAFLILCVCMQSYMRLPQRIAIPFFLFYSFSAILLHSIAYGKETPRFFYLSFALIVIASIRIIPQFKNINHILRDWSRSKAVYLNSAMGTIKSLPADSILILHCSFPFEGFPIFSDIRFDNPSTIILIGWINRTPDFYTILDKRLGISSGREFEKYITTSSKNIYMFGTKPFFDTIQRYIKENYEVDLQREVIARFESQDGELFKIIVSRS